MDWANEAYVRLYVRDTTTWKRLGFEGTTMLMHLMRKVDRAGVLDIEDMAPAEAAALHVNAPAEFAAAGVSKLLELKVMVHDGTRLVFPNFIVANETPKSDKQRQKESREKRAVTKRDAPSPIVTESHTPSQSVTLNSAQLSRAQQSVAESAPPARDHWADGMFEQSIRSGFQQRYENAVQSIPNQSQVAKMSATVAKWVAQTARLRNQPEDVIMRQLVDGFFASDSAREKGFPPSFLAANPLEYFEPRKKSGPDAKVQQSTLAKLEDELAQLKTRKRELDKSDPEYDVRLYEFNRDINAAQERRDSAKRKLDATG